jgi:hypothetical protein
MSRAPGSSDDQILSQLTSSFRFVPENYRFGETDPAEDKAKTRAVMWLVVSAAVVLYFAYKRLKGRRPGELLKA